MAKQTQSRMAEKETSSDMTVSKLFWRIWDKYGILIILVGFGLTLTLLTDRFLTVQNLINIIRQVSVMTLIALGVLTVLITGNVDLTVGAFLGLAGALFAGWSKQYGVFPALVMSFGVAFGVGLTNGFLSTRGRGLSVIVTLAMMSIFQGALLLRTQGRPIIGFPESIRILGTGYLGPVPWPVLIALLMVIIIHIMLEYSAFGRQLYAIGGNRDAAHLSGIPVIAGIITAFVISAALSAVAGLVLLARVSSAQPTAGLGEELNAVGAVLIGGASLSGGAGTVLGTIAGVLILGMISNGLNLLHVNPFYQYVAKGLIILFAILMDQWGRE